MSPTEFDLRAALREGEGDGLDAGLVVAGARAYRARRRSRILSTAATVVCVAAVGGVLAGVLGTSGTGGSGESGGAGLAGPNAAPTATAPQPAAGSSGGVPGRVNQPYGTTTLALPGCPATRPDFTPPAGGSGGVTSASTLVPEPVRSFVVCSYGSGSAAPNRLLVTGNGAVALQDSLQSALPHPPGVACPHTAGLRSYALAIIGVTAPGKTLPTITTTLTVPACNVAVTNGTVVRYGWQPPQGLLEQLGTLGSGPVEIPSSAVTPGRNEGSPVR